MTRRKAFMLDKTLIALADPTRRAILTRLAKGEARITDVAEPFPISLNSVSKHIRTLEGAGLVRRRKAGREHLLSLDTSPLDRAELWLHQTRALWAYRLTRLASLLTDTADDGTERPSPARSARKGRKR